MARNKRYKDARNKRDGKEFFAMPYEVLRSRAYRTLSTRAKALLLDMTDQYRGNNNGDICACFNVMRAYGWRSEQTLFNARKELEESGLIFETRKGARPNRPTLFAFTWLDLDEASKLEVTARSFPRSLWRMKDPAPPIAAAKNAALTTKTVVAVPP